MQGIIPALEPSHAIYYSMQLAKSMKPNQHVLVNCCGRGDKDMITVRRAHSRAQRSEPCGGARRARAACCSVAYGGAASQSGAFAFAGPGVPEQGGGGWLGRVYGLTARRGGLQGGIRPRLGAPDRWSLSPSPSLAAGGQGAGTLHRRLAGGPGARPPPDAAAATIILNPSPAPVPPSPPACSPPPPPSPPPPHPSPPVAAPHALATLGCRFAARSTPSLLDADGRRAGGQEIGRGTHGGHK